MPQEEVRSELGEHVGPWRSSSIHPLCSSITPETENLGAQRPASSVLVP